MSKKIIAIVGSYRKGGITDQAVDAVLSAARRKGAEVKKIYLVDRQIEFCTNCRTCLKDSLEKKRGKCIFNDGMNELLCEIDSADGLILGAPVNFGTATAIMKRFIERCVVYGYWPWDKYVPEWRIKERDKKAVIITSSAAPVFIGKILMPSALDVMKACVRSMGGKIIKSLYFGMVCQEEKQILNKKQLKSAELAGNALVA